MSGNADAVLNAARSKLNYAENPPRSNRNEFSAFWGQPSEAWCDDFVCWALAQGHALDVPRSSYTPTSFANYQHAGRAGSQPRVGATVYFQWPGMDRIGHVGLVEVVRPGGAIVTIEGNTDEAGGRTGGKVMRHVRRANIVGYGYPAYDQPVTVHAAYQPRVAPLWLLPADHYLGLYDPRDPRNHSGHDPGPERGGIAAAQAQLLARGYDPHGVDGEWGRGSTAAMLAFQRDHGMPQSGKCGRGDWVALWQAR